jgi:hypothetical protein
MSDEWCNKLNERILEAGRGSEEGEETKQVARAAGGAREERGSGPYVSSVPREGQPQAKDSAQATHLWVFFFLCRESQLH